MDDTPESSQHGFRGDRGKPTFTTTYDWVNMASLPDASIRIYHACRMFILKDGSSVVSLTNEEIGELTPYQDGSARSARSVHNAMKPLFTAGLFVEVETTKVSVDVPGKSKREVRTIRTFAVRDEPPGGWDAYTGPTNPFTTRERMAERRRVEAGQRRADVDRKDVSAQSDQDKPEPDDVSAGQSERKDPAQNGKDLSQHAQDLSGIGSKHGEPSTWNEETDSLRSSVPRASASDHTVSPSRVTAPSPADAEPDERTNEEIDPKPKAVVRGLDVTAVLGREITDEHRDLAQQLSAERDSEIWDVVAKQTGMSKSQRRQLAALLPRAVALVGGDLDRVRGWLYEKGLQATVATYVLNALDDERIEDVWTSMPMEHIDARVERARQAEIAAQERQERQNAGAESHWGQKAGPGRQIATQGRADDPWASATPRSVASTEGQEEGEQDSGPGEPPAPEPARELLINAEFDPTVQQVNTVRNAIELHGYEAVDNVVKDAVERGEREQLASVLRSFNMSMFARTVADLSR